LAQGWIPGKNIGVILAVAYEAQLEGAFSDLPQALTWLSEHYSAVPDAND
jgi:hypothetical protein